MFTMPSMKTALMISGVCTYLIIVHLLNKQSIKKFDYSFFSKQSFVVMLTCTVLLLTGMKLLPAHRTEINLIAVVSYLFLCAGSIVFCILIWINCKETSWWRGIIGSLIQVPILALGSIIYIPFIIIIGFFKLFGGAAGSPPPGKPQYQKDMEWYHDRRNPNGFHRYEKY